LIFNVKSVLFFIAMQSRIESMNDKIFSLLDKVAETSDHSRYQMSAAIVLKNRVIAFGSNRMKTHPFQAKYGSKSDRIYLHAEIHAIKNALKSVNIRDLRKANLYVLRKKDKGFGMAKPCEGCMRAIVEFGLRSVTYTTENGYETI
jgi:deoxycytidylate deaminase